MGDKFTREGDKRFTLRIDSGTFETIQWCAKRHKRSVGREIEIAIEYYLDELATQGFFDDEDTFYSLDNQKE